jgi:hypothetical protein
MTIRTTSVATSATIFELAISTVVKWRSVLSVTGIRGGKAYHERKETKKPSQESRKTLPCKQNGF